MLEDLSAKVWNIYEQEHGDSHVVQGVMPILFFGDSEMYMRSKCKVVTVALNPSDKEFPFSSLQRFPKMDRVISTTLGNNPAAYIGALNDYFEEDPYSTWFGSYEQLLNGMGYTYNRSSLGTLSTNGRRIADVALHTDFCSPLATCPTWDKLPQLTQSRLMSAGEPLWRQLIDTLAPDIVVASMKSEYVEQMTGKNVSSGWQTICEYSEGRSTPYTVRMTKMRTASRHLVHVVFGQAAQTPFGTLNNPLKQDAGKQIFYACT